MWLIELAKIRVLAAKLAHTTCGLGYSPDGADLSAPGRAPLRFGLRKEHKAAVWWVVAKMKMKLVSIMEEKWKKILY